MNAKEHVYYALGELVYAVTKADGEVQPAETEKLKEIVRTAVKHKNHDFDITEIIFSVMSQGQNLDVETTYEWAMKELKTFKREITDEMRQNFVSIIEKVAMAYEPVTVHEKNIIDKFRKDIENL